MRRSARPWVTPPSYKISSSSVAFITRPATLRISSRNRRAPSSAELPCTRVLLLPRTPVSLMTCDESSISTWMESSGTFSSSPTICRIMVKTPGPVSVTADERVITPSSSTLTRAYDSPPLETQSAIAQPRPMFFILLQSEEHTSELQSLRHLVCRLLLEKKKDPLHFPHRVIVLPLSAGRDGES